MSKENKREFGERIVVIPEDGGNADFGAEPPTLKEQMATYKKRLNHNKQDLAKRKTRSPGWG